MVRIAFSNATLHVRSAAASCSSVANRARSADSAACTRANATLRSFTLRRNTVISLRVLALIEFAELREQRRLCRCGGCCCLAHSSSAHIKRTLLGRQVQALVLFQTGRQRMIWPVARDQFA
jgi:hypothetical protein